MICCFFSLFFRNLATALLEDIAKPLKHLVDGQHKARKPVCFDSIYSQYYSKYDRYYRNILLLRALTRGRDAKSGLLKLTKLLLSLSPGRNHFT